MSEKMDLYKLIKKLEEGSLSQSETSYLLKLMGTDEPEQEMKDLLQKMWDESREDNREINSKWLYNKIISTVSVSRVGFVSNQDRGLGSVGSSFFLEKLKEFRMPFFRYAIVLVISFGLFWLIQPFPVTKKTSSLSIQFQSVEVPYGSKSKVELPDGSVVILNSGSKLSYNSDGFNSEKRSVSLEGEGFFNVKKDSTKPFYVNTKGMLVKVLGTTFNLKAYPDEITEEATLVKGSVQIFAGTELKETGIGILLKPNDKAIFNKIEKQSSIQRPSSKADKLVEEVKLQTLELQNESKMEQVISWKNDRLIFDNEPFGTLLIKIERWYDVHFQVLYPELNNARFTGKFDKETVEQVLNALASITPFHFEIRKNQITINY